MSHVAIGQSEARVQLADHSHLDNLRGEGRQAASQNAGHKGTHEWSCVAGSSEAGEGVHPQHFPPAQRQRQLDGYVCCTMHLHMAGM